MNETTQQNLPPSENLSVSALAASMLAKQIEKASAGTSSSATETAAPSPETPPAVQPTGEGTGEPNEQSPEAEQQLSPTIESPAGDEANPEAEQQLSPTEEDHRTEAETEALQPLPRAVQSLRDRVHTVCDQRDAAREAEATAKTEAETLRQANQQLAEQVTQLREGTPPNMRAIDRFSGHPAVKDIDARLSNVDATLAWCDANPEGGESRDEKGNAHQFSAEEVRRIQRQVERDRAGLVAERANKVGRIEDAESVRRSAADVKARKSYPWLAQQQSPEFQTAVQIGKEIPGLLQHPEFILHMGDLVRGRLAREADEKRGAVRPAAPAKKPNTGNPPNVTTQPAAAPRVTNPLETQVQMAEADYERTGKLADLTKLNILKSRLKVQTPGRAAA